MKKRISARLTCTLVALTLSVSAYAHPGHSHTVEMLDWLLLLAGFAGIGRAFYCLSKAKHLQLQQRSQREVM